MRALCVTLALVTLATLQAQAKGSHWFPTVRSAKVWFAPAPRVQVFVVKYRTVIVDGLKERVPYITPKLHCYTVTLCVPVYKKAPK